MGGTVTEPEWKNAMRKDFSRLTDYPEGELESLVYIAAKHAEAAYRRGLIAGRSQAGYGTRRKRKEEG